MNVNPNQPQQQQQNAFAFMGNQPAQPQQNAFGFVGGSQPAPAQSSGTLFDGMNVGSQQPAQNTAFNTAPQQQQNSMGLFDGLNQQPNTTSSMPAPQQQTQPAKSTMWDGNGKLFDLSADSLKQTKQQP